MLSPAHRRAGEHDGTHDDRRRDGDQGHGRPGRRVRVRLSRRRGAADLRRAGPAGEGQAHPGPPGRRRGACGGRLRALDRQGRRRARHVRPRRHQRGHRPHRRAVRFHSRRLLHRPGADASDRLGRVPGVRHGRHHALVHQAQLSREERRRPRPRAARGVLRRAHRPARPGRRRHPQGRAVRDRQLRRPVEHQAQDLQSAPEAGDRPACARRSS